MLIHEVCRKCSLSKKAVEYYIGQGLILPEVQENGYRIFSDGDVLRLKKISVLRNLGLSVMDIRDVLSSKAPAAVLKKIYHRRNLQVDVLREKQKLIRELATGLEWEQVQSKLEQFQKKQTVLERLMNAFPGNYGKFLCLHFAPYLTEPITTDRQQGAFDRIISFLDSVDYDIPADLKEYLDEISEHLDEGFIEDISAGIYTAIHETGKYIADNKKEIETWLAYKQSEEYKATPVCRMEKALRQFNSMSGYNNIFIPAMCQLSDVYRKYHEGLRRADKKLIQKYPEMNL